MAYNCPLKPPHVNEDGTPMVHKNRKACMMMGLANRGNETHPEKFSTNPKPEQGTSDEGVVAPQSAGVADGEQPAPEQKPKKGKFGIVKKQAGAPAEGTPEQKALVEQPKYTLGGDVTLRFWDGVVSLFRSGVELGDQWIKAEHPYDVRKLRFTASEEEMVRDVMPGPTTRFFQWLGFKSAESAERAINALTIIRLFGRMFVGVGWHFVSEVGAKNKAKREAAEAKKKASPPPPAPTPAPPPPLDTPIRERHPTPAQMERMNLPPEVLAAIEEANVPAGARL